MGPYTWWGRRRLADTTHLALSGAVLLVVTMWMPLAASGENATQAVFDGRSVDISSIADFHCHDRDAPLISCFSSSAERDVDITRPARSIEASQPYVTVFADEGYGGASFTLYNPISALGAYGWNDRISSFKSLNAQRPRLYTHADYGTPSWRWAAGAWVSNVGSEANDVTSSIENDP